MLVLDARDTIAAVRVNLSRGVGATAVAARFHEGVAAGAAGACRRLAEARSLDTVALGGGFAFGQAAIGAARLASAAELEERRRA